MITVSEAVEAVRLNQAAEALENGKPADAAALLGGRLVEEMPPAEPAAVATGTSPAEQPAAPAAAQPAAAAAAKPAKAGSAVPPTDVDGRTFDPLIHETTPDGRPVLRTDGRTLKKRRAPLKAAKTTSSMGTVPEDGEPAPAAAEDATAAPVVDDAKAEAMLQASAATLTGVQLAMMRLALGPKCGDADQEREGLMACWADVLRYHGVAEVNPWIGLAMVSGMVAFKAVHEPANESAITKLRNWFQRRALSVWQWITGRRAAPEAKAPRAPVNQATPPASERAEARTTMPHPLPAAHDAPAGDVRA